jgi:hypothetical protein
MFQQHAIRGDASWLERKPSDFQQMTAEIMSTAPGRVAGALDISTLGSPGFVSSSSGSLQVCFAARSSLECNEHRHSK